MGDRRTTADCSCVDRLTRKVILADNLQKYNMSVVHQIERFFDRDFRQ